MGRETELVEGDGGVIIYIAGPITGEPNYKDKFAKAERELRRIFGWDVLNPARQPEGLSKSEYMQLSYRDIENADMVVFLPGWRSSKGARLERQHCRYIDKPIAYARRSKKAWAFKMSGCICETGQIKEPLRNGNSESGKQRIISLL